MEEKEYPPPKCPHCGGIIEESADGRHMGALLPPKLVSFIAIICPHCGAILGAVNKPPVEKVKLVPKRKIQP